jgi:hypothetical protein
MFDDKSETCIFLSTEKHRFRTKKECWRVESCFPVFWMLQKIGEKVRNQDSIMCTVTSLCAGQSRVQFLAGARNFSHQHPDRLWGPSSHLFNRYWWFFPKWKGSRCEVDHHLYQVPRLGTSETVPLLLSLFLHDMQRDKITYLDDGRGEGFYTQSTVFPNCTVLNFSHVAGLCATVQWIYFWAI